MNIGNLSSILGLEKEIEIKGVKYTLAPLTMEVMGRYEQWFMDRTWDIFEKRKFKNDDARKDAELDLIAEMAAGAYGFWSKPCLKSTGSLPGMGEFLLIRLQEGDPKAGITREFVQEYLGENFEEAVRHTTVMDAEDPNSPRPQTAGVPCE